MASKSGPSRRVLIVGLAAILIACVLLVAVFSALVSPAPPSSEVILDMPTSIEDPTQIEGYADTMAWRLCSHAIRGENIEAQLALVVSLDKELFDDPFALQVVEIVSRLETGLMMQEIGEVATELTGSCHRWRRANAEGFN